MTVEEFHKNWLEIYNELEPEEKQCEVRIYPEKNPQYDWEIHNIWIANSYGKTYVEIE